MWLSERDTGYPLQTGNNIEGFSRMGKGSLANLANALALSTRDAPLIQSIPDIYFHASKFAMSLFGEAEFLSVFSGVAKREWRALLAVCITAGIAMDGSDYELVIRPITCDDIDNAPYTNAALAMKPATGIWKKPEIHNNADQSGVVNPADWTWDGLKVILLCKKDRSDTRSDNGEPIAFTSPDTIVFPAANWNSKLFLRCPGVFPWIESDRIIDPADKTITLPTPRVAYIAEWLNDFRLYLKNTLDVKDPAGVKRFDLESPANFNKLCNSPDIANLQIDRSLLSEFRSDLIAQYNLHGTAMRTIKSWDFDRAIDNRDPYERSSSSLEKAILPAAPSLSEKKDSNTGSIIYSDVLVDIEPINGKPVIFLCESDKEKVAAGMYTVDDVLNKDDVRDKVEEHFHILKSDEVFLENIIVSRYNMKSAGATEPAKVYRDNYFACVGDPCIYYDMRGDRINLCFMPLRENALDLVSLSAYKIDLTKRDDSDSITEITVSFDLRLTNNTTVPLSRVYSQRQMIEIDMMDGLPIAAVWPRVNVDSVNPSAGWKQYWVFCYNTPDSTTDDPRSGINVVGIPHSIEPIVKFGKRFIPKQPISDSFCNDNCKYYNLDHFPQYMQLTIGSNVAGYLRLQPVKHDPPINVINDYPCVLDFGTASTIMLGKNGMHNYADPTNNLGVGHIIGIPLEVTRDSHERSLFVSKYFMRELNMPFATLLRDFDKNDHALDRHLYEHAHIYFKELRKRDQRVWPNESVAANMKWSGNRKLTELFLCDLFRFALLDAALLGLRDLSNILLMVSYPDSMADGARTSYSEGSTKAFATTSELFVNLPGTHKFYTVTESEAAARYFVSHLQAIEGKTPHRLAVIDIGGGTSDIYYTEVYSDADNTPTVRALESSVKIGARDILVKALHRSTFNSNKRESGEYKKYCLYNMLRRTNLLFDNDSNKTDQPLGMRDFESLAAACQNENDIVDFAAVWEGFLNRKFRTRSSETTLGDELLVHWKDGTHEPPDQEKKILSFVALHIAGIVYYTAILLRESKNLTSELCVAFAGNGSKMLDWLGQDINWKDFLTHIIHQGLSHGNDILPRVTFYRSPAKESKHETVKGMFDVNNGSGQLPITNRRLTMKESQTKKERLAALQTIIAGERYAGGGALTIDECEQLLDDTLTREKDRFTYEQDKKRIPLVLSDETNKAESDLSDRDFTSDILTANVIEESEFNRFLGAYNDATERFRNAALFKVIKDTDRRVSGGACFELDMARWRMQRNIIINKYINAMKDPNNKQMELKSFFLMGIEALNEELKYLL
jgi:hypothetical protein